MNSTCSNSEPFALQVTDHSMAPEFPSGCIIVVEPGGELEDGCYVVAENGDGVIFRRLVIRDESWTLEALQDGHDRLVVKDPQTIRGRVIQRAGKRKTDRKRYV